MEKPTLEKFYNKVAPEYDHIRFKRTLDKIIDDIQKRMVLKFMGNLQNKPIIDIGCGTGRLSIVLAKNGAKVTGIDISQEMIKIAKKRYEENKNINFARRDIEEFPSEFFKGAVSMRVVWHLENPLKLLKEINRILKPNSYFVIDFPNKLGHWNLVSKIIRRKHTVPTFFYSEKEIRNILSRSGFKVLEFKSLHSFYVPNIIVSKFPKIFNKLELFFSNLKMPFSRWFMIKAIKV